MDITHFLGASILAGLFVFIGAVALTLAIRSWLSDDKKEWLDSKILQRFKFQGLGQFKENSMLLTLALVLIYPIGDATLHILDDVFEDRFIETRFEKEGRDCKEKDSNEPGLVNSTQVTYTELAGKLKNERDPILFHWYHNLDEGTPSKLKFTRIGEIEAREDQNDRETIDKEKSYLQFLQIFILLFAMIGLALLIYISRTLIYVSRDILHWLASGHQKSDIRVEKQPDSRLPSKSRSRLMDKPLLFWHRMKEQLSNPIVWKPLVATILLVTSMIIMLGTREEYEENEDKYERLVFHVWKNHLDEKLNNKKETEATKKPTPTSTPSV
jgi:hypothetical protein